MRLRPGIVKRKGVVGQAVSPANACQQCPALGRL